MDINAFIDTYSDDVIYLREGRSALLTHPLRAGASPYLDASTCRLLTVFMIGSIEAMLKAWRDRDHMGILQAYFAKGTTNGDRVSSLYQAFADAGIPVDRQIFDDYLATKYLRNTIVHAEWKEREKEWLDERGFPTDTRKLTKEHLDKIDHVGQNMMFYIFLTSQRQPTATKPGKLVKLDEAVTRQTDETGILRSRDIDLILWNNLERIDEFISGDIEKAATSEAYDWTAGRTRTEVEELGSVECKRLFYLAARRAGEENHEVLARHRALAAEALAFWHEYWQRAAAGRAMDDARIQKALEVLLSPGFARLGSEAPWCSVLHSMPEETAHRLVDVALESGAPFTSEQIVDAFRAGHLAYECIRNITPVTLFTLRLPIVDPVNTAVCLREGDRALRAFSLNRAWYSWVEDRRPPDALGFAFYERMRQELAGRPLGTGA